MGVIQVTIEPRMAGGKKDIFAQIFRMNGEWTTIASTYSDGEWFTYLGPNFESGKFSRGTRIDNFRVADETFHDLGNSHKEFVHIL